MQLANEIPPLVNSEHELPPSNLHSNFLEYTNEEEILKVTKNLKLKSGGVDGIHTKVLVALQTFIVLPLVHIINTSLYLSICPDALKKADVIPVHKADLKSSPHNY